MLLPCRTLKDYKCYKYNKSGSFYFFSCRSLEDCHKADLIHLLIKTTINSGTIIRNKFLAKPKTKHHKISAAGNGFLCCIKSVLLINQPWYLQQYLQPWWGPPDHFKRKYHLNHRLFSYCKHFQKIKCFFCFLFFILYIYIGCVIVTFISTNT